MPLTDLELKKPKPTDSVVAQNRPAGGRFRPWSAPVALRMGRQS
jgi:hypothetical protein